MKKSTFVKGFTTFLVLSAVALGLIWFVSPELLDPSLRTELSATGLVLGRDDSEQMKRQYGPPSRTVQEHVANKYEYDSAGLLFRFDGKTGLLNWVEYTGPTLRTGRGIGIGDRVEAVLTTYGKPSAQVDVRQRSLLRYSFAVKYSLEFWVDATGRVERVIFHSR